jgi:hypothetical protein
MNVGRVRSHTSPQPYGRVMTHVRRCRQSFHYCASAQPEVDHLAELTYASWKRRVKFGPSRSDRAIPTARAFALVRTVDLVMVEAS